MGKLCSCLLINTMENAASSIHHLTVLTSRTRVQHYWVHLPKKDSFQFELLCHSNWEPINCSTQVEEHPQESCCATSCCAKVTPKAESRDPISLKKKNLNTTAIPGVLFISRMSLNHIKDAEMERLQEQLTSCNPESSLMMCASPSLNNP